MSRDALDCMAGLYILKDKEELFLCHLLWKGPGKLPDKLQNRNDLGDVTHNGKKIPLLYIDQLLAKRKYTTIPTDRHNKLIFLFTFKESKDVYIIGTTVSGRVIRREDDIFSIPINELNTYTFKIKLFERNQPNNRQIGIEKFKLNIKPQDGGLPVLSREKEP